MLYQRLQKVFFFLREKPGERRCSGPVPVRRLARNKEINA
jgi:hypothetical protein